MNVRASWTRVVFVPVVLLLSYLILDFVYAKKMPHMVLPSLDLPPTE